MWTKMRYERIRAAAQHFLDTFPGPGYPHFVIGRVDFEPEDGAFMPREKSKILSGSVVKTRAVGREYC
jgi:hypothetical protein